VFYPDSLLLRLHTDRADLRNQEDYRVDLYTGGKERRPVWKELDKSIDVVAFDLPKAELEDRFVFTGLAPKDFIQDKVVLGLGDPVIIIGYPYGFSDELHGLPVARQGALASVPRVPFRGKRYFLVDANLHPGTSGSPVITKPSTITVTKTETVHHELGFLLLGINSGAHGDLELNIVWFTDVIAELIQDS